MELESTKNIPTLLERLMKQYLPADHIQKYKPYFLRLLSTRISAPTLNELLIKTRLQQQLPESKSARFGELHLRLTKLKAINKRTQILYILSKILESPPSVIPFKSLPVPAVIPLVPPPPRATIRPRTIVMEQDLIQDILSILIEKQGKYFEFSEVAETYSITNADTLAPFLSMAEKILELAWLHKKIVKYVELDHLSQTCMLLARFFQSEIDEYYTLVTAIKEDRGINLRKLSVWCAVPTERMKHLATVADSAADLKGSQVISMVFNLTKTGDPAANQIMLKVMERISVGLTDMIDLWVRHGRISDPYNEFFIEEDHLVGENDLWEKKYKIKHELVPSFFDTSLVTKILLIGKSINFTRICCMEEWVPPERGSLPYLHDLDSLSEYISKIAHETNRFLLSLINFKYSLELHFSSLKKYLLLAQGDFHHFLMEDLYLKLGTNAKNLYKHDLVLSLEKAIQNSALRFENIECLSRLDVKLLEASPLDTGWDIFLLDYILSPPLTTIFTQKVMESYLRAFKFLWQVKRAHYLLNQYQHSRAMIVYQTYYELRQVMHAFQLLRHEISHFINNLMSYLILEVVEVSWKEFSGKLENASDFDDMIEIHRVFLERVMDKGFLDDEGMYRRIMGLVDVCVRFYALQQELLRAAEEERNRREVYIRVGNIEEIRVFEEMMCDIELIKEQFNDEFNAFQKKLIEPKLLHLKFLAFRLDFNEYYELKSLEYLVDN